MITSNGKQRDLSSDSNYSQEEEMKSIVQRLIHNKEEWDEYLKYIFNDLTTEYDNRIINAIDSRYDDVQWIPGYEPLLFPCIATTVLYKLKYDEHQLKIVCCTTTVIYKFDFGRDKYSIVITPPYESIKGII